ncbi:4a-hydroxytetrahydrobiopterin dehydratase [Antricoccus suffuscus]|nr:4a-hydroxytetrahydrobiopterin dehydratase [Antricoccus suffuscus]
MSDSAKTLTPENTSGELKGSAFTHTQNTLQATFDTGDFVGAVEFLNEVMPIAEELNHHPDVEVGYGKIAFTLSSHDVGGVTTRDLGLARRIDEVAHNRQS